jgi:DNA-binding transcriptional ArsR family regulator
MEINDMEESILMINPPVQLFSALGHPVRLAVLEVLREGEACVCHIQAVLGLRQAYASQHLNVLRQAGLIISRKDGTRVYYQLASPAIIGIVDQAKELLIGLERARPEDFKPIFELSDPDCSCPQCMGKYAIEGGLR